MPAATAKTRLASTPASTEMQKLSGTPIEQVVGMLENKIRNLRKRQSKLDQVRAAMAKGEEVTAQQQEAVSKYEEVDAMLRMSAELEKAVKDIMADNQKSQKAMQKQLERERQQQEANRIRQLLLLQEVLNVLGAPERRPHFERGTEGAPELSEEELGRLDKLFEYLCPSHEEVEDKAPWQQRLEEGAHHAHLLLSSSPKPLLGSTYKEVRELLDRIVNSDYLRRVFTGRSASPDCPEQQGKSELASTASSEVTSVAAEAEELETTPATAEHTEGSTSPPAPTETVVFHNSMLANGAQPPPALSPPKRRPDSPSQVLGRDADIRFIQEDQSSGVPQLPVDDLGHGIGYSSIISDSGMVSGYGGVYNPAAATFVNSGLVSVNAAMGFNNVPGPPSPIPMPMAHLEAASHHFVSTQQSSMFSATESVMTAPNPEPKDLQRMHHQEEPAFESGGMNGEGVEEGMRGGRGGRGAGRGGRGGSGRGSRGGHNRGNGYWRGGGGTNGFRGGRGESRGGRGRGGGGGRSGY